MADIAIVELTGFGLATIVARKGVETLQIGEALGVDITAGPQSSGGEGLTMLGTGPRQWLAYAEIGDTDWIETLSDRLGGLGAAIDQSSAYVLFNLTGTDARRLLQKGLSIDLAPAAFPPGAVAVSVIAHIGVIAHHVEPDTFRLAIFRSFAESFRRWLDAAIAAL